MSYLETKTESRQPSRSGARAAVSVPARAGAISYLIFALSVGFTAAVVFGLLA